MPIVFPRPGSPLPELAPATSDPPAPGDTASTHADGAPALASVDAVERGRTTEVELPYPAGSGRPLDALVPELQLAVTRRDADLNSDGSSVRLHRSAAPTATLSIDEILAAPRQRRDELLRRYHGLLQSRVGRSATTDAAIPAARTIQDGPWQFQLSGTTIDLSHDDGPAGTRTLHIDLSTPEQPALALDPASGAPDRGALLGFLLKSFAETLFRPAHPARRGRGDPELIKLFTLLLGPQGLLNPQDTLPLRACYRFASPKLIAWDFNSTVGDGKGRFRPDMRDVTDNLNRMGAASVITTTIDPLPVEKLMGEANIRFNGFFGFKEVREYPANKHYRGVAESYGLDPAAARGRMVVIGDSETDIPSDLSGVLFVHNDDQTPAEAIELLLYRLDQAGGGRFDRGLEQLLRDRGVTALPARIRLDDLSFAVELRDGGRADRPCPVPVICDLRVHFDTAELTRLLATVPDRSELIARGRYDLALRTIEGELDAARLPEVLRALAHAADRPAVIAAGDLRLRQRQALLERARTIATGLMTANDPRPMAQLLELCSDLAAVGDSAVAAGLDRFARAFPDLNARALPLALRQLDDDVAQLRQLLERARTATPPLAGTTGPLGERVGATTEEAFFSKNEKAAIELFRTLADDPLDESKAPRKALIKRLELFLKQPFAGAADLFEAMERHLDGSARRARAQLRDRFAERDARCDELTALVPAAFEQARAAEPVWAEVDRAWQELVRA